MIKLIKVGDIVVANISEFYGLKSDVVNLPINGTGNAKYITTASTFFCIDTGDIWMFEESSNKWYQI